MWRVVRLGRSDVRAGAVVLPVVRQGSRARVRRVGCPGVAGGTVAARGAFRLPGEGVWMSAMCGGRRGGAWCAW